MSDKAQQFDSEIGRLYVQADVIMSRAYRRFVRKYPVKKRRPGRMFIGPVVYDAIRSGLNLLADMTGWKPGLEYMPSTANTWRYRDCEVIIDPRMAFEAYACPENLDAWLYSDRFQAGNPKPTHPVDQVTIQVAISIDEV